MSFVEILTVLIKFFFGKLGKVEDKVTSGRDSVVNRDFLHIGSKQVNIHYVYYQVPPEMARIIEHSEKNEKEILKNSKDSESKSSPTAKSVSEDYKQVIGIVTNGRSQENKITLRSIYHSSADKLAQLQVILALAGWFDGSRDSLQDMVTMCDAGIEIAQALGLIQEKAILLAFKGGFLSFQFSLYDMDTAFKIQVGKRVGIHTMSEREAKRINESIQKLDKESESCFMEAEKIALEIKSLKTLAFIYLRVGTAAGIRFNHLNHFGIPRAQFERELAKRAIIAAKRLYDQMDDEVGAAYALHNMANVLRGFGPEEKKEAKMILKGVIKTAEEYKEQNLLRVSSHLLKRIESGTIPNYSGGEKFDL